MAAEIAEADWRVFKALKPIALDRLCARVLAETAAILADATRTNHQRFLAAYARINEGERCIEIISEASRMLNAGQRPAAEIAREFGIKRETLYRWRDLLRSKPPDAFHDRPGRPAADGSAEAKRLKRAPVHRARRPRQRARHSADESDSG